MVKKRPPAWVMVDGVCVPNPRGLSRQELINFAHGKPPRKDMRVLRALLTTQRAHAKSSKGKGAIEKAGGQFFPSGVTETDLSNCHLAGYVEVIRVPAHTVYRLTDEGREKALLFLPTTDAPSP